MISEEIQQLVIQADEKALLEAVSGISEAGRSALLKEARIACAERWANHGA